MGKLANLWGSFLVHVKKMCLETLFISIFVLFALIFIVLIPLGWNTDEFNHTYRIYQLSSGDLLSEKVVDPQSGFKAYGGQVPQNLKHLFDETGANAPGWIFNPANKVDRRLYKDHPDILTLKDNGRTIPFNFSGSALYSPATYAPYLPIFWLGQLLSMPFFWILMLCRLAGVALVGLTFYFAIKYIPAGKWVIFTVGLLPSVVIQAESIGADAPQLAACVLLFAAVTTLIYKPIKLRWPHYAGFAVACAWLTLIKLAYAPFLLLLLVLPLARKEYRTRNITALLTLTIIISLIPSLIWTHMVSYIDINSNPQADFVAQRAFVLHQPITYAKILYHTFFTNEQAPFDNLFGSFITLPAIYSYVGAATLAFSLMVKSGREVGAQALEKINLKMWRASLLVISFITTVLIATTLYIYSTTLHQSSVVGIQSRYFLPVLPLLLLAFHGNTARNQRIVKISIVAMLCIILVGSVLVTYHRLYQTLPTII